MVRETTNTTYECPYCGDKYDDIDEAEECARDCADVDSPIEDIKTEYYCEICDEKYDDEYDAGKCEHKHMKNKDKLYMKYIEEKEFKRMLAIGNHPYQTKLL